MRRISWAEKMTTIILDYYSIPYIPVLPYPFPFFSCTSPEGELDLLISLAQLPHFRTILFGWALMQKKG